MNCIFRKHSARKHLNHISKIHNCNLVSTLLNQGNIMADKSNCNILFPLLSVMATASCRALTPLLPIWA